MIGLLQGVNLPSATSVAGFATMIFIPLKPIKVINKPIPTDAARLIGIGMAEAICFLIPVIVNNK